MFSGSDTMDAYNLGGRFAHVGSGLAWWQTRCCTMVHHNDNPLPPPLETAYRLSQHLYFARIHASEAVLAAGKSYVADTMMPFDKGGAGDSLRLKRRPAMDRIELRQQDIRSYQHLPMQVADPERLRQSVLVTGMGSSRPCHSAGVNLAVDFPLTNLFA